MLRDRAEIAALIAGGVRLERDVLEQEAGAEILPLLNQPAAVGQLAVHRPGQVLDTARPERRRPQLSVAGIFGPERSVGEWVVEALRLDVKEGLRPPGGQDWTGQTG